uniref:C2H2-type domain-containing protein n=1 Tax=Neogobius melanostomus TaxID=47308 RepID=A0A8C6SKP8_9GOBI
MSKKLQPIVLINTSDLVHLISDKYICAQCMHVTSSVDDLIEHHSLQHPMRSFQLCTSCGKYLVYQDQSRKHLCGQESITLYDITKTHFCKYCGKCFRSPLKVNKHYHNVHKKQTTIPKQSKETSEITEEHKKYKCLLCPMTFNDHLNRNRHLKHCLKANVFGKKNRVNGRYKCPFSQIVVICCDTWPGISVVNVCPKKVTLNPTVNHVHQKLRQRALLCAAIVPEPLCIKVIS